jgi:NodT family efflux transporter outer membrane factor (OMF) lipoprotein
MTRPPLPQRAAPAAAVLLLLGALAGCATPRSPAAAAPDKTLAQADVPAQLPAAAGAPADTPATDWQGVVRSPRLRQWVAMALQHNRDLRVAALNVQRAQAQLGLADANRLPSVGLAVGASRAPNSKGEEANTLAAGVQLSSWEIDLFGRLASLSEAARAQLAASQAGQRASELAVVATVLQSALALQADDELLALARETLASREQTLKLTRLRESVGAASLLELQAQIGLVAQARATLAQLTRQQALDGNALALLLGQPLPAVAAGPQLADEAWLAEVPSGLSSAVLLRRPDVLQAEQALRAADANIDAARAAFWPSITLTAQAGQASPQLSGLFQGGNFVYTVAANALLTVFDAGRRAANVAAAEAAQQIAQAQYERAIQAAFRETADALAGTATWREQADALQAQRAAARETARLTELRATQGAASTLELLEAQRGLWAAEQAVLQARLGELSNRVALFKALGGG